MSYQKERAISVCSRSVSNLDMLQRRSVKSDAVVLTDTTKLNRWQRRAMKKQLAENR